MRGWVTIMVALAVSAGAKAPPAVERGSGPYPAIFEALGDLPDHVVYRPRDLAGLHGAKMGIYVFGNGGCSADGTSSRNHLLEIASHGYLVIAPGHIPAGEEGGREAPGGPLAAQTRTEALSAAIDWAQREAERRGSPFFHRVDPAAIAVSGWSCGGLQALSVAQQPRVRTAIIMNSGFFNDGGNPIAGVVSDKKLLGGLHGPTLYVLGGKEDIAWANGTDDYARIGHIPSALVNIPVGHGGTYMQPHGGLGAEVVTAWLDWQLKGDRRAAARFVGPDCGYCRDPRLTIESRKLR
ncbi:hypothetical protein SAMIE_1034120 [Sphingobium amiense]|uniref:Alpha/beta hydrolase n=1 Tax=Sphingobium amiense TaxID=135719 RepID=A0A494W6P4_9SPHN|nr:hypothetical protein [Sphingobium amiense]BBD99911.1 hypothetical protein SAMIE_1034120 [Sphingobium amiense]